MPHVLSPRASVMQVQAECGPLMTAKPSEVPFFPVLGAAQSQRYVAAPGPLEPRSQEFAASYVGPRPDGKRNWRWNSKKAQQRSRKKSSAQTHRAHFNAMKKANRQQTRKHFKSKYATCACCWHLCAVHCLGPGACADTDSDDYAGLAQTPHTLPPGSVINAAQSAIMEATKPGAIPKLAVLTSVFLVRLLIGALYGGTLTSACRCHQIAFS